MYFSTVVHACSNNNLARIDSARRPAPTVLISVAWPVEWNSLPTAVRLASIFVL